MINKNSQNGITKESIFTALMILMEQKNFNEISITELAKKAGVSRMAFYRNYNKMEDIITNYLDEFLENYAKRILGSEKIDNYESVRIYFAYFRKQDKLINNLNNSNLNYLILERCTGFFHVLFQNSVCKKSHFPERDRYTIEFLVGGLYKVLIEWANSGMKESDEEMSKIICDLMNE
ncbi:TetR/AcrR family transcriptional regulator [Clostridium akagii]|uniref:TetR/AcrR family transcriptional regulator n=1 Tax=Clostridium akagii TaxID=91623 RepID=UPI00047EDEB0|nr:TetR/AcrR family transcriptional regulator [Clostridium akagii]